jgi:hypothetical protein
VIFQSYVSLPEGIPKKNMLPLNPEWVYAGVWGNLNGLTQAISRQGRLPPFPADPHPSLVELPGVNFSTF